MMRKALSVRARSLGEILLLGYLFLVIAIAILRALTGFPTVAELASSPAMLLHGEWWRLATSAFVIDGPPLPQVIAIAVLGSLGIYFGGSWTFWSTALAGHFLGTLIAYAGLAAVWLDNHAIMAHYLTDPDYGVSLIWCAALGAFAALAWLGQRSRFGWPARPLLVALCVAVMVVVTIYSDDMGAVQHVLSFVIAFGIAATADRTRIIQRERHPLRLTT